MTSPSIPIRRTMMRMIFIAAAAVLAVTVTGFCTYEFITFRQSSTQQLQILSQAIASNSTAALAFDNTDDAVAVLAAFKADPHIVAAALYGPDGRLFAAYPKGAAAADLPARPGRFSPTPRAPPSPAPSSKHRSKAPGGSSSTSRAGRISGSSR